MALRNNATQDTTLTFTDASPRGKIVAVHERELGKEQTDFCIAPSLVRKFPLKKRKTCFRKKREAE